tara:strand:+ start:159 stop:452 length:294 start_codon:yes stop_codon:yes gene_type:complete
MNAQTKLVFALEHVAHLHDLFEDNPFEQHLKEHLITIEVELERQLQQELSRKNINNEYATSVKRENQAVPPRISANDARKTIQTSNRNSGGFTTKIS